MKRKLKIDEKQELLQNKGLEQRFAQFYDSEDTDEGER